MATAYRYFQSAEDLWFVAGVEPVVRLDALIRVLGFAMLDDQAPYRRLSMGALATWFAQIDADDEERAPVKEGRRNRLIAKVLDPLRGQIDDVEVERIEQSLALVVGTDAMVALTDTVGLSGDEAKQAMRRSARWLLTGALADVST